MANEIAKQGGTSMLPADITAVQSKYADDKTFDAMSAGSFLPRVQLLQSGSKLVTKNKMAAGDLVLVKGKDTLVKNYADNMPCWVLKWRPKALCFAADGKGTAFFNPKTPGFQKVEAEACKKPRPKGYLFGPEFLIYLPDVNEIATFHFSTPTMRNRTAEMRAQIGIPTTVLSEFIDSRGNQWYGPVIQNATSPIGLPEQGTPEWNELIERIKSPIDKFVNPPDEDLAEEVEGGAEAATGGAERPR